MINIFVNMQPILKKVLNSIKLNCWLFQKHIVLIVINSQEDAINGLSYIISHNHWKVRNFKIK